MRQIFDPCVNRTLRLLDGQIDAVMSKGAKIKVEISTLLHIYKGIHELSLTFT
jgi:hypothetical protein